MNIPLTYTRTKAQVALILLYLAIGRRECPFWAITYGSNYYLCG
jgi:hypothetical protein